MGEVVIGDGNCGGAHDGIDKSIGTVGEGVMVDPDMAGSENGDGITISHGAPPVMRRRAPDHSIPGGLAVMDVKSMDDDVGDELNGDARTVGDMNIVTATIYSLETVHDQLLLEGDDHVALEDDPERYILDDSVAESARLRVDRVVVAGVVDHVESTVTPADGVATEPDSAVREPLSILVPVRVAPPAVINRVPGPAREEP